MIISVTGFDGVGKSTSVEMLSDMICSKYHLHGCSAKIANNNSLIYHSTDQLDRICKELDKYDVISCPFYLRTEKFQTLQEQLMYSSDDVFTKTDFALKVVDLAKKMADNWFEHVVYKLNCSGKILLFDRYYYDEIAYRSLYGIDREFMEQLYYDYRDADIRIYMVSDLKTIYQRNAMRSDIKGALFCNSEKTNELLYNLNEIAEKYGMLNICINNLTKEEVADILLCLIEKNIRF